jgi:hypothetical protein
MKYILKQWWASMVKSTEDMVTIVMCGQRTRFLIGAITLLTIILAIYIPGISATAQNAAIESREVSERLARLEAAKIETDKALEREISALSVTIRELSGKIDRLSNNKIFGPKEK